MEALLERLNDKQIKAVTTDSQYCRVIAGAGSGKTRVLTNRFVYLLDEKNVAPYQILAITFTNKAANEIKNRILRFLPNVNPNQLNVFTFHSFCLRFLRREISIINKPKNFVIIDDDDQDALLKRILKAEGYNAKSQMYKDIKGYIGYQKTKGLYPEDVVIKSYNPIEAEKLRIYKLYQEALEKSDQLDFDDLLLKTLYILDEYEEVRNKWKKYFTNILVDEFQDTNDIQYRIIQNIMCENTALYVVGDPDQTIYTWRGANQDILLNMKRSYPNIETIILDENYRSTSAILNAANNLIKYNKGRIEKNLFTSNQNGMPVVYTDFYDSFIEAKTVVQTIKDLINMGYDYKDIVIMYRANYLTLPFEKVLVQNQIPYTIYGGLKFYQRKEVKDILAFLRLMINKNDNISFERIINIPKRGIGDTSIEKLHEEATFNGKSYYDYIVGFDDAISNIPSKAKKGLKETIEFLDNLKTKMESAPIDEFLHYLLEATKYKEYLSMTEENAEERYENVETLLSDIVSALKITEGLTLDQYLENIALLSAQDYVENKDVLTLMTVHTSKGLEFPVVFVTGVNEGVFPSARAIIDDPNLGLEEERRICYVAFTRAMEKLYVSSFRVGFRGQMTCPSNFIKEAGLLEATRNYKEKKRLDNVYTNPIKKPQEVTKPVKPVILNNSISKTNNTWKIGDRLRHVTFGYGIVIGVDNSIISVRFEDGNVKKLLGAHASLTKVGGNENHEA